MIEKVHLKSNKKSSNEVPFAVVSCVSCLSIEDKSIIHLQSIYIYLSKDRTNLISVYVREHSTKYKLRNIMDIFNDLLVEGKKMGMRAVDFKLCER